MAESGGPIRSIQELRQRVPSILKRLNSDQRLAQAAAANPLLALEELGYSIPNELRRELDQYIRFTADERTQLAELGARMHELAGGPFAPDDPQALEQTLFEQLKLPPLPPEPVRLSIEPDDSRSAEQAPAQEKRGKASKASTQRALTPRPTLPQHRLAVAYASPGVARPPDVLESLRGAHPIIEPLIAYRAIAAKHAPFAPREIYERVRRGDVQGLSLKLRARLHRNREE